MPTAAGWSSEVINGAGVASVQTPIEATDPVDGSTISVHVFWQLENAGEPTVTDTEGNTYVEIDAGSRINGSTRRARKYCAYNIVTGPDFQVTATWAGVQFAIAMSALEITGAATADAADLSGGQAQNPGVVGAGATTTGAVAAPSVDGCLLHASSSSNSWPDNYDIDSPFTEAGRAAGAGYVVHGYDVQTTAAAATATFTQDSTAGTLTMVTAIKPAAAPAGIGGPLVGGKLVNGRLFGALIR